MTLLATRLRNRRIELNLSQEELAIGICKQGQISRIERGIYNPGSELLYKLSVRLNVSMDYFFDENLEDESNELQKFKILTSNLLENRDYDSLHYIYELEVDKESQLALSDRHYLRWIGIILLFHYQGKTKEALFELKKLLGTVSKQDKFYFKYLNSLLNFYSLTGEKEENYKEIYNQLLKQFDISKIKELDELNALIKIKYNHCHHLWKDHQTDEAIKEIIDAIKICKTYNSTYLLPDLYCLLGNVSEFFSEKNKLKEYYTMALTLYKLNGNDKLALMLESYIKEKFDV